MSQGIAVATSVAFVWLGMVLAISFLEAPLKFRAPGVTTRIGLGIGRLVFRALNVCELIFAVVIAAALFSTEHVVSVDVAFSIAITSLFFQTVIVRPLLARRTIEVLEGDNATRSRAHFAYIALDVIKVIALIIGGIALLTS